MPDVAVSVRGQAAPSSTVAGSSVTSQIETNSSVSLANHQFRPTPNSFVPAIKPADGALLGARGTVHASDADLRSIHAFEPRDGALTGNPIVLVNGINTGVPQIWQRAQMLAERTREPVIALYNHSDGIGRDILQSIGDKTDIGHNPAVDSLSRIIVRAVRNGDPLHIVGESQGALIVSRALFQAIGELRDDGTLTSAKRNNLLGNITVETFGGAASIYPSGPRYVHYTNDSDPVSWCLGVGKFGISGAEQREVESRMVVPQDIAIPLAAIGSSEKPWSNGIMHPGENARIVRISEENAAFPDCHHFDSYVAVRKPVESIPPTHPSAFQRALSWFSDALVELHHSYNSSGFMGHVMTAARFVYNTAVATSLWLGSLLDPVPQPAPDLN